MAQEELARAEAVYAVATPISDSEAAAVELAPPADGGEHLAVSRSHPDKIAAADAHAQNLGPFWGDYSAWEDGATAEPVRLPAGADRKKQAGFYVGSAPGQGGRFNTPLDFNVEPVSAELERVAKVVEMALIRDQTSKQSRGTTDENSAEDLHWVLLRYAHPQEWAEFVVVMEEQNPDDK